MLDLHHISPYPATVWFRDTRLNEAIVHDKTRSLAMLRMNLPGFAQNP